MEGSSLKKVKHIIGKVLIYIIVIALIFGAGVLVGHYCLDSANLETVGQNNDGFDLKLPGEAEKRTVTNKDVQTQLKEISEFSTYSGEYNVNMTADYSRYFLCDEGKDDSGIKIPGTKNTIDISCEGVVKVGYDFDLIEVRIDDDSHKIYIKLPEVKVNDNYIKWESVVCEETNCILNPIEFEQYQLLIEELEKLGLKDAEEKDIYSYAEENVKTLIMNALSEFNGFEVVFM